MRFTTFITITIFVALLVFIFLMSFSRSVTTQSTLLILPKSEVSAVQAEHVIRNIAVLSEYKHFADGKFPYSLSGTWDGHVSVARKEGTGIVALRATVDTKKDAAVINKAMTQSALRRISKYYDITKDVDVRVIGAPRNMQSIGNITVPVIVSVLSGLLLATIVFSAMKLIKNLSSVRTRSTQMHYQPKKEWISRQREEIAPQPAYTFEGQKEYIADKRKEELAKVGVHDVADQGGIPEDLFEKHAHYDVVESVDAFENADDSESVPAQPVRSAQHGSAPSNLPIIDVSDADTPQESAQELVEQIAQQEKARQEAMEQDYSAESAHENDSQKESDVVVKSDVESAGAGTDIEIDPSVGEPTDEELKERLNKLLRGDL